ncbi:MAG: hypothetical protein A2X64_02685 [Ignavibacteria bacterium GWF2_33_9]|nr:MAG: hypothetical protein A2X64_02685 [Ignavibacteria bacterium GWF2_33_9]
MKKALFLLLFALVPVLTFAQNNQKQDVKILKPSIVLGDLVFVSQTLKSVEIKGEEVDAFMAVDKHITDVLKDMSAQKKTGADTVVIDYPADLAQNTLIFMNRAKLSGQYAVVYKRFVDAIMAAAK